MIRHHLTPASFVSLPECCAKMGGAKGEGGKKEGIDPKHFLNPSEQGEQEGFFFSFFLCFHFGHLGDFVKTTKSNDLKQRKLWMVNPLGSYTLQLKECPFVT